MPVLIACSMLRRELEFLIRKHDLSLRTVWMEKGLHEYPQKCRESLQREIDACGEGEQVLLAYGLCGNATLGLHSGGRTLIIPKFDDCIRMLLAPDEPGEIPVDPRSLYFTEAWIDSEKFLFRDLDSYVDAYGEKRGMKIAGKMIGGYRRLCLIDSGDFYSAAAASRLREEAKKWGLEYGERAGSTRILEKLLLGKWDGEFCRIGPESTVDYSHFEDRARCADWYGGAL